MNEAENAWKPTPKKDVKDADEVEVLCKKIRSILNKLCPQKFDTLVGQFNDLETDTEEKLTRAMQLVFEKAVDEPGFSVAYARMCLTLGKKVVKAENGSTINNQFSSETSSNYNSSILDENKFLLSSSY